MEIKCAGIKQLETVKTITVETIKKIYPHYYPSGAVDFFLSHHSTNHIVEDIQSGAVFLLYDNRGAALGTVTIKENEICRLFVLPDFQKRGIGKRLLEFAENKIGKEYDIITLSSSLPAKSIYLKRGYLEMETHSILTENDDYLCYDVMQKVLIAP